MEKIKCMHTSDTYGGVKEQKRKKKTAYVYRCVQYTQYTHTALQEIPMRPQSKHAYTASEQK